MTATAVLRPFAPADIPAIRAIYADAVIHGTASWELEPPDEAEMARRAETILGGGYPYLVAEVAGRLAGYAYASAYRPRAAYRYTIENSIYVDPSIQRAGVGRALLSGLIAAAGDRGFRQMIAVIGDSDNAASIGLHRAMGFAMIGVARSVGFKHGRWLDQVLMQRAIGEGDASAP
ncbi:GNAT family N-acetyltransferase [Chthonobacter albigriseus]|uniref:GNAT family N-acetyltransferase n=1 Tax=Chthonobacter albigriseus TaxID=1683161 RepID=UPI0015EE8171|nr:GNAT family N-acetyltransferase [Chthonobacter albigriseus]